MNEIKNQTDIISALKVEYDNLIQWLKNQEDSDFDKEIEVGKWTAGQHADHIIKSTQPLNKALRMPKLALKTMFGKKNERPEKNYQGVVEKYQEKLAEGGVASGDFLPKEIPASKKEAIINQLQEEVDRLVKVMDKWDEEKLSTYLLPHPLIGKMTIREMMFFTVYHTHHHYMILKERF